MRSVNTVHPSKQHPSRRRAVRLSAAALTLGLLAAACGSDDDAATRRCHRRDHRRHDAPADTDAPASDAPTDTATTDTGRPSGDRPAPAPRASRCSPASIRSAAPPTEAAGTITYLSSFDFAAAASIVDVVVAEQSGYFDDLCLDVELLPELLDRQLPAGGQQRGAVLVGRQLHRDPQQHRTRAPSSWRSSTTARCRSKRSSPPTVARPTWPRSKARPSASRATSRRRSWRCWPTPA